jgi:hypothetical protein
MSLCNWPSRRRHVIEYGAALEWYWREKAEGRGERLVRLLLCPARFPHTLTCLRRKEPATGRFSCGTAWEIRIVSFSWSCTQVCRVEHNDFYAKLKVSDSNPVFDPLVTGNKESTLTPGSKQPFLRSRMSFTSEEIFRFFFEFRCYRVWKSCHWWWWENWIHSIPSQTIRFVLRLYFPQW